MGRYDGWRTASWVMDTHLAGGMGSRLRRPLRNLPDEATSGVVNDTILAKAPPLWIPAFAGMTVVRRSPFAGTTVVWWRALSPSPRPSPIEAHPLTPALSRRRGRAAFLRPTAREGGFETRPYSTTRGGEGERGRAAFLRPTAREGGFETRPYSGPASPSLNSYDSSTSGVVHEDRGVHADRV